MAGLQAAFISCRMTTDRYRHGSVSFIRSWFARIWYLRRRMFTRFLRIGRWRMAGLMAVLYALCVLVPAAAFAFGDGSRAAQCLSEENHSLHVHMDASQGHMHSESVSHAHHQNADSPDHPGKQSTAGQCCGLVCLSALPATNLWVQLPTTKPAAVRTARLDKILGQIPPVLYRPPNTSTVALS